MVIEGESGICAGVLWIRVKSQVLKWTALWGSPAHSETMRKGETIPFLSSCRLPRNFWWAPETCTDIFMMTLVRTLVGFVFWVFWSPCLGCYSLWSITGHAIQRCGSGSIQQPRNYCKNLIWGSIDRTKNHLRRQVRISNSAGWNYCMLKLSFLGDPWKSIEMREGGAGQWDPMSSPQLECFQHSLYHPRRNPL